MTTLMLALFKSLGLVHVRWLDSRGASDCGVEDDLRQYAGAAR